VIQDIFWMLTFTRLVLNIVSDSLEVQSGYIYTHVSGIIRPYVNIYRAFSKHRPKNHCASAHPLNRAPEHIHTPQ